MREEVPENLILISEAFEKVRAILDPAAASKDEFEVLPEEWWYRQEHANWLLQNAVSEKSLVAFTSDPATSQIIQLDHDGWTPEQYLARLSPEGWYDFELAENADASDEDQHEKGYRPIFFDRDEFQDWLRRLQAKQEQAEDSSVAPIIFPTRGSKERALFEAIAALTRDGELPAGINWIERDNRINRWLKDHGRDTTSRASIGRALQKMRERK